MDERTGVAVSACVGAAIGGVVGWVLFTSRGHAVRQQVAPRLSALAQDVATLGAAAPMTGAAGGGWHGLLGLVGDLVRRVQHPAADDEGSNETPGRYH